MTATRKHLYLITEHDDPDAVGCVSSRDSSRVRPEKNCEGPIRVLDDEKEGFATIGQMVHIGYYDFASEEDFEERIGEVMREKIREVDREWAEKAGVVKTAYGGEADE